MQACVNSWVLDQQRRMTGLMGGCAKVPTLNLQGCINSWIDGQLKGAATRKAFRSRPPAPEAEPEQYAATE